MTFLDRRGNVFLLAAAHYIDEVREVRILADRKAWSRLLLLAQPSLVGVVVRNGQVALRSIVEVADRVGIGTALTFGCGRLSGFRNRLFFSKSRRADLRLVIG